MTIDTLPDDALLYVFDFYGAKAPDVETWHTLVHVCRRWRALVFASPRRLKLRIACTDKTSVREKLDIWPALPIVVSGGYRSTTGIDNIGDALRLNDRVCNISISLMWELGEVFAALQKPFPALTDFNLVTLYTFSNGSRFPVSPNPIEFLSGSTHLRSLSLTGIPIPELPKLLLSFTDLVDLRLNNIHMGGLPPPDAMVNALSALTRLKELHFGLEYHGFDRLYPDWETRLLYLPLRAILPSLTTLKFEGASEYLEDLVARIDAPLLDHFDILFTFFYLSREIVLDTPRLLQFISRIPKLQEPDKARIGIGSTVSKFHIDLRRSGQTSSIVRLEIFSMEPERQSPCLAQFCRSPLFPLPTLECLYIDGCKYPAGYQRAGDTTAENTRWLELFRPFTFVKNLFLSTHYALHIASALQGLIGEGAMEVLPTLENVFIEDFRPSGSIDEAIGQFVAERHLSGHPITVSRWDKTGSGEGYW